MSLSARKLAADVLQKIERRDAYSTLSLRHALENASLPDPRDFSLTTRLVYGVTEHRLTIDHNLQLYLKKPLHKLPPPVVQILRVGAYQLLYSDKIPPSAAVNESVRSVKEMGYSYAAGLVNAVLRRVSAGGLVLPPKEDRLRWASLRYSVPTETVKHFASCYGWDRAERILASFEGAKPVYIRINSLKSTAETLSARLGAEGASMEETGTPGAYILTCEGNVGKLGAFRDGLFYVQDLSSQICVSVLGARPGETVLDCCAAPGGKAFGAAIGMENRGRVIACDLYPQKCGLIENGAQRLGLSSVKTAVRDARLGYPEGAFADRVLCDVPCSGLGVMGRKPEIRYKALSDLADLPALQLQILTAAASAVKKGGALVYSTCTLNPAENENVCRAFLQAHPAFAPAGDEAYRATAPGDFLNCFPGEIGSDGFFIAKMIRR